MALRNMLIPHRTAGSIAASAIVPYRLRPVPRMEFLMKASPALSGLLLAGISGLGFRASAAEPSRDGIYLPAPTAQTEADEYTRYELLAPESGKFKITYEVTAVTTGARLFYNPIRKGSVASDEAVIDAMTGKPLHFEIVSGADARKDPLMPDAELDTHYIKVTLARPVPASGEGRLVIVKTYEDRQSYYVDGKTIVFDRPLGIRRNKVVLPAGYEIVGLNVPSQVITEADGRIGVSFVNGTESEAPLVLRAAKGEIVYFLQQPESHAFALYHNYTESRPGINGYANVVRTGSTANNPSASILDTGEVLQAKEMSGAEMAEMKINAGEDVDPKARVVVIPFAPVQAGQSLRLRITETYTAPASYKLDGNDLVFDRSLGRPRNAVVLPSGWYCTFSSIPATVSQLPDGRVQLDYWNGRPEPVVVLLKARRRIAE
jgi:hypothetical protein